MLAQDGPIRLVAVGTGPDAVDWVLDGATVATTLDGQPARVNATAGAHVLWARSSAQGHWRALARPESAPPGGAQAVTAWTAVHEPEVPAHEPGWLIPVGALVGSAALLVRPRSLLQSWSRRRRP